MNEPTERGAAALPAREIDARDEVAAATFAPRDQSTGTELTADDLGRTLLALRSLNNA